MVTSTILGPDGRPITTADLAEPQTAQLQWLQHEFQGHPSRGLTPSKLAGIMDGAERGDVVAQFDLYDDMEEKDAHIASEMGKRRRAITLLDWDIVPPSSPYASEKRAAKQLKEWVAEIPDLDGVLYDLTDAIGKGFVCLEIEWELRDGVWLPKTITHRPQSWFVFHRGYREEIRLRHGGSDGTPLQPAGWITHVHKAKSGWLARAGLFRALAWPYLFKNYSVADLAEFLEIYGIPLRVGKYPPGASDTEKRTLLNALATLGHKAAGIIPEGMMIDFQEATKGDPDAYQLMIDWCERSQSKAILGGTLTSQADGKTSTNALGTIHDEVRKDLRDSDVKQVAATLTRDLLGVMAVLNGLAPNGPRRAPRWQFNIEEPEDLKTYSESLPPLVAMGMRIPRQWAQEKLGIPEPEADDEDLLGTPAASTLEITRETPPVTAAARAHTHALAACVHADAPPDYLDVLAERMASTAGGAVDGWITRIRHEWDQATDYDDLLGRLSMLLTELPLDELGDALAQGFSTAALAGQSDVQGEGDA